MILRDNAKYDLATVSSMGVRITPADRQPVHTSNLFTMQSTSAETNVLNVAASLGMNAMVMTRFVKDSAVANFIKAELRKRNISYIAKEVAQGGPWGYR
ncbi:MAG: sugar kinase, partial [Clostridia bacterium]|nr:sugar kinase [Clostridia bacterium]